MSDEPAAKPPITPELPPKAETVVSEVGSANAPYIFFDEISGFGAYNGIAHMTLPAMRFIGVDGKLRTDQVVVAHLRMNLVALKTLKDTIPKIELLLKPAASEQKN
jgi:hypothetical protein